jgi:hypothetical protein
MAGDIFICTYWKDTEWLEFCVRWITRYARLWIGDCRGAAEALSLTENG